MSPPPGVPAAPNRSHVKAKVVSKKQSDRFPDKWLLEIEIVDSRSIEGPNFARAGQHTEAFSFDAKIVGVSVGSVISAEAEYLGGPTQGQFQLSQVAPEGDS